MIKSLLILTLLLTSLTTFARQYKSKMLYLCENNSFTVVVTKTEQNSFKLSIADHKQSEHYFIETATLLYNDPFTILLSKEQNESFSVTDDVGLLIFKNFDEKLKCEDLTNPPPLF